MVAILIRRHVMVRLERIKISDAKILRSYALLTGSLSTIEDEIRSFIAFPQIDVMVAYDDDVPIAMIKIHLLDRKNCRVHLNFVIEEILSDELTFELLDKTAEYCLITKAYHKITVTISSGNMYLEEHCMELGFVQESVLADEIENDGRYEDAGLFRLLSADYRRYNACFVPFEAGIAVIKGGTDYIDGIRLYQYGAKAEDGFVLNVARQLKLVDNKGCFLDNTDGIYSLDEDEIELLPEEVSRAYIQVKKYFKKTSSSFDLNLRMPYGTDFQQKVWKAVTEIRYGSTKSYEDIAIEISGGDSRKAKTLTRAVGNACSENPLMLVIPCHRVIGKDGKLAGFSAGVEVQDYLLTFEAFSYVTAIV